MGNVGSSLADVSVHLAHDSNMFVTVEKRVLFLTLDAHVASACMRGLVRLEAGVREDDNEAFRILVGGGYGGALLGHKLRQLGRRERLGSCHCRRSTGR